MSSKRGETQRSRGQKYQNRTVFKNNLHDNSDKIKRLNNMSICEVCTKCKEVIQWKIKYRKYKPLTQPKTCNGCNQRTVVKAYHVLCRECAIATKQCAKCLKKESDGIEIIAPELNEREKIRLDNEMKQMVKTLSERKRRTFLRYMKGKAKKINSDNDDDDGEKGLGEIQLKKTLPTRDELIIKLDQLKLSEGNNDDDDDDDDFYDDIISSDEEGWASELSK